MSCDALLIVVGLSQLALGFYLGYRWARIDRNRPRVGGS